MTNEWTGGRIGYGGEHEALEARLGYNLLAGCEHNGHEDLARSIERVVFEWTDGDDEPAFAWLVEFKDGRFAAISGSHDYTGWDCQSGLNVDHVDVTLEACAPFLADDPRRAYREKQAAK